MKKILLALSLITLGNVTFTKNRVLKNELSKTEKEFLEGDGRQLEVEEPKGEIHQDNTLPKFFIRKIILKGPNEGIKPLIKEKYLKAIIREYENRELNLNDLKMLVKNLNNIYVKKGYATTRVYLEPDQNISSGEVRLVVLEGRIEDTTLDSDTEKDRRKMFFAFTNQKGKILNMAHLDNGIDNLNRLESNNSRINIVPGEKQGYSRIILESQKEKPFRFILNYEDTQKNKRRYKVSAEYDNLLGINDHIYFTYRGDVGKLFKSEKNKEEYTESYFFGYSFPVKTWSFYFSHDRTEDNSILKGSVKNYDMRTKNRETALNIEKLLYRDATNKLYLTGGLSSKREELYLEKVRLETQDRKITVANIGIKGMAKPFKGIASYSLVYSKGIKGLGALKDNSYNVGTNLTSVPNPYDAKYQFDKINFNISYYKPLYFNRQGITIKTVLDGQYTKDSLFAVEKYSIGGKGFPTSVSGDKGIKGKIEIGYILPVEDSSSILFKLRPYIEAEAGKVRNNYNEYGEKNDSIATLSNYAAGVKYYGERITLDFGVAKTDKGRSLVNADPYRGYVNLTATF